MHSEIIEAGFLDYLEGLPQDGRLFPSLKPGGPDGKLSWFVSKRFTTLRRKLGITRERVGFHCFRKAVGTKLVSPAGKAGLLRREARPLDPRVHAIHSTSSPVRFETARTVWRSAQARSVTRLGTSAVAVGPCG